MRDGRERKVRSSSFFYQNMASRASGERKKLLSPSRPRPQRLPESRVRASGFLVKLPAALRLSASSWQNSGY